VWCLVSVDARLAVNVALNRPSYQVSTFVDYTGTYPARRANDGGHGTNVNAGSCMLTNQETNPYWAVDLGVRLKVHSIQFTNRDDSGAYIYTVCSYLKLCPNKWSK